MIKVVVIEDRVLTLNALRESIDWNGSDIMPIGFFESCDEALPFILSEHPDVVVTDIVMCGMNGIELCVRLRAEASAPKVIIISAHSQFEYAQRALQVGVFDYFEKPVDYEELLHCIVRAGEERFYRQQMERYINNHMAFYRDRFFTKLLLGQLCGDDKQIGQEVRFLGLPEGCVWRCGTLSIRQLKPAKDDDTMRRELLHLAFTRQMEKSFGRGALYGPFSLSANILCFLFSAPKYELEFLEQIPRRLLDVVGAFSTQQSTVVHAGIGEIITRVSELKQSYEGAKEALDASFFFEESMVLTQSELPSNVSFPWYGLLQLEDRLIRGVHLGDELAVSQVFEHIRCHAEHQKVAPTELKLLMKSIVLKAECVKGQNDADITKLFEDIGRSTSMDSLFRFVERHCLQLCADMRHARTGQSMQLVENVKRYIECNYANARLCLEEVSRHVSMSPNYLSSLFKKQCGKGIHEYMTELRVNRARELLITTDTPVAQVGDSVGYSNPYYFSINFKKNTNFTPTEYRRYNQKG